MRSKRPLTELGRTVRDLMESRGIEEWATLTTMLNVAGWDGTRTTFTNWMRGKHPTHPEIIPLLVEVLELNGEEKQRLADAFTYGQGFKESQLVA